MAGRERPLDPALARQEPVHRPIQLVLVGTLDATRRTERAHTEEGRRGELGRGGDQAARHERRREVPHPRRAPVEDARQPERAEHPEDRGDMAVGQAAADGERLARGQEALAREPGPDELDEWLGQVGQVGQGLLLDLAVLAVRVAEQRARVLAAALAAHHPDYVHSRSLRLHHAPSMHIRAGMSSHLLTTSRTAQQAASATDPSSGRVVTGPDQARRALEVRLSVSSWVTRAAGIGAIDQSARRLSCVDAKGVDEGVETRR